MTCAAMSERFEDANQPNELSDNDPLDAAWLMAAQLYLEEQGYKIPMGSPFKLELQSSEYSKAFFWHESATECSKVDQWIGLEELHEKVHALLDAPKTVAEFMLRARPALYDNTVRENGELKVGFRQRWERIETPNSDQPYHFERTTDIVDLPEKKDEDEDEDEVARALAYYRRAKQSIGVG